MKYLYLLLLLVICGGLYILSIPNAYYNNHNQANFKPLEDSNPEDSLIADETYLTPPDSLGRVFIYTYNDKIRAEYINKLDWIIVDDFYCEDDSCKITWFQFSNHALPYDDRTYNLLK